MARQDIKRIMCCCGNGVGTSLLMQMTIQEALENIGRDDIEVIFGSLSDITQHKADLFVVSKELENTIEGVEVLGLSDLMDSEAAAELLKGILE